MGPPERGDERTGSQRRAHSLVEMAQRHLDRGDLAQGGCQRPHLMVISQLDTLKAEPGSPAAELVSRQPVWGSWPAALMRPRSAGAPFTAR